MSAPTLSDVIPRILSRHSKGAETLDPELLLQPDRPLSHKSLFLRCTINQRVTGGVTTSAACVTGYTSTSLPGTNTSTSGCRKGAIRHHVPVQGFEPAATRWQRCFYASSCCKSQSLFYHQDSQRIDAHLRSVSVCLGFLCSAQHQTTAVRSNKPGWTTMDLVGSANLHLSRGRQSRRGR